MILDRGNSDARAARDLFVGQTAGHKAGNVLLARRQSPDREAGPGNDQRNAKSCFGRVVDGQVGLAPDTRQRWNSRPQPVSARTKVGKRFCKRSLCLIGNQENLHDCPARHYRKFPYRHASGSSWPGDP